MNKGMSTPIKVIIVFFIVIIIAAIFIFNEDVKKRTSEKYYNFTNNTSIPGMTLDDIKRMFEEKEGEDLGEFYCANAITGMLEKDFCTCTESGCEKDIVYTEDNHCNDAVGDYDTWKDDNTKVAVCLEGDGCCSMPDFEGDINAVGQCLYINFEEFNGEPLGVNDLFFRIDVDSPGNCNNDLNVYNKYEGNDFWNLTADGLDGGGKEGLEGIHLSERYFPKKVSITAICPDNDGNGDYDCDHKIDWVMFRTPEEPDIGICSSGEWSEEVLLGLQTGNAGIETRNYTVKTKNLKCEVPGVEGNGGDCMVTKIYRKQVVEDWGGVFSGSGDFGQHNNGLFIYSSEKLKEVFGGSLEEACIAGGGDGDWRTYEDEMSLVDKGTGIYYSNGEDISLNSNYWELTGTTIGCSTSGVTGPCNGEPKQRKCCSGTFDTMCAKRSYNMGDWELKVYGKYCCPEGMKWDGSECVDI